MKERMLPNWKPGSHDVTLIKDHCETEESNRKYLHIWNVAFAFPKNVMPLFFCGFCTIYITSKRDLVKATNLQKAENSIFGNQVVYPLIIYCFV